MSIVSAHVPTRSEADAHATANVVAFVVFAAEDAVVVNVSRDSVFSLHRTASADQRAVASNVRAAHGENTARARSKPRIDWISAFIILVLPGGAHFRSDNY